MPALVACAAGHRCSAGSTTALESELCCSWLGQAWLPMHILLSLPLLCCCCRDERYFMTFTSPGSPRAQAQQQSSSGNTRISATSSSSTGGSSSSSGGDGSRHWLDKGWHSLRPQPLPWQGTQHAGSVRVCLRCGCWRRGMAAACLETAAAAKAAAAAAVEFTSLHQGSLAALTPLALRLPLPPSPLLQARCSRAGCCAGSTAGGLPSPAVGCTACGPAAPPAAARPAQRRCRSGSGYAESGGGQRQAGEGRPAALHLTGGRRSLCGWVPRGEGAG